MSSASLVKGEDILKYIPQRNPIVMVDSLFDCAETSATTGLSVSNVNEMFMENGNFLEAGLIEHMAQSCALHAGYAPYMSSAGKEKEPLVGFIAEVKSLTINHLPSIDQKLTTKVEIVNEVMNINVVRCETKDETGPVCSCEMKIFLQPEE